MSTCGTPSYICHLTGFPTSCLGKLRLREIQSFAHRDSREVAGSEFQPDLGDPAVNHTAFRPPTAHPALPSLMRSLASPQVSWLVRASTDPQAWPPGPSAHPLPLRTGVGTKRLLSRAGSVPRKLVPGAEPAGARTILLDTPPAGQGGDFSLSLFGVPPLWGVGTSGQGEAGGLTCVGARDEPEAAILQRGIFQSNPHAQHPAQRLRIQEGGVLVRGDCSRPTWA